MAINLWPNADLEDGIDDWNVSGLSFIAHSSTQAWEETYSINCDTDGRAYGGIISDVKFIVEASTQYIFSFYMYVEDAGTDIGCWVGDQDSNTLGNSIYSDIPSGEWIRYTRVFTTGVGDTGVIVRIRMNNDTTDTNFYVDGAMLETGGSASTWVDSGGTFPADWGYRVPITINKDDVSADLTNWTLAFDQAFDSVLTQADGPLDADGTRASMYDGGDIRFSSDEAGSSQLACDIREWSTNNTPANATCEVAVMVPAVSSSGDTTIYMWWGITGESQPLVSATYGQYNAYDSDHIGVWPFRDWTDHTSGGWDADTVEDGAPAVGQTGGPLGEHAVFADGDIQNTASITHGIGTGEFAFEALVKRSSDIGGRNNQGLLGMGDYSPGLYLESNAGGAVLGAYFSAWVPADSVWPDITNYHHLVFYRLSTTGYFRVDGATDGDASASASMANDELFIGSGYQGIDSSMDGLIAELRFHKSGRSTAWWDANYANFFNTSGFLTWGSISDLEGGIVYGSASISATGVLAADGFQTVLASTSISATGALDASGFQTILATASLAAAGTLNAAAFLTIYGSASFLGVGLLTAEGFIEGEEPEAKNRLPRWLARNVRHAVPSKVATGQKEGIIK